MESPAFQRPSAAYAALCTENDPNIELYRRCPVRGPTSAPTRLHRRGLDWVDTTAECAGASDIIVIEAYGGVRAWQRAAFLWALRIFEAP